LLLEFKVLAVAAAAVVVVLLFDIMFTSL